MILAFNLLEALIEPLIKQKIEEWTNIKKEITDALDKNDIEKAKERILKLIKNTQKSLETKIKEYKQLKESKKDFLEYVLCMSDITVLTFRYVAFRSLYLLIESGKKEEAKKVLEEMIDYLSNVP